MRQKNIALLMLGVASGNCGGAERFFADFFKEYQASSSTAHKVYFFLDPSTYEVLKSLGKLDESANIVILRNVSNRFKRRIENWNFRRKLFAHNIDIIHVCNYGRNYFDRLTYVRKLSGASKPKIVVNIVDCEIPYVLGDATHPRNQAYAARYMPLFNDIRPDAYYSWYVLFGSFVREKNLVSDRTLIESAQTRFADTKGFAPSAEKKKHIVFAARLTEQKRPMMFIEALSILKSKGALSNPDWKFFLYGNGPLEQTVKAEIDRLQLKDHIQALQTTDLRSVYASSSCFVSTQDYENFPSLSMNEAMAAGNVIVARNVGQTSLFVKDGVNGYLAQEDNAFGIAAALEKVIRSSDLGPLMSESIRLAKEVHTPANFIRQIDEFWSKVAVC